MQEIDVFVDGSCIGNGKGNAKGGMGIYYPNKELRNLSITYTKKGCTNQKTELMAILIALKHIAKHYDMTEIKVNIKSDSKYCINSLTNWIQQWKKNNWKTSSGAPVLNKTLIKSIDNYIQKYQIVFTHVKAHTGKNDYNSKGNYYADKLATLASVRKK